MSSTRRTEGADPGPDTYVGVNEACRRFGISRRTFYRMLAEADAGLAEVVLRIPPRTGPYRVPVRAFEQWLRARQ